MHTRKYKIICDGLFIGFIFIADNNPRFPDCKVGTIWPFDRQGNWTAGDLELLTQGGITDIYDMEPGDEDIHNDLMRQAEIKPEACRNFEIVLY